MVASITPSLQLGGSTSLEDIVNTVDSSVKALPGIESVAVSVGAPHAPIIHFGSWHADLPNSQPANLVVESYDVSPEYFRIYGIPILKGRALKSDDVTTDIVIGQTLAARLWPDLDPIGRSVVFENSAYRVIGISGEIRRPSLDVTADRPEFYRRLSFQNARQVTLNIRCSRRCPSNASVRRRLFDAGPTVNVSTVQSLSDLYYMELSIPRSAAVLGSCASLIAIVGAVGGVFGIMSYVGARRRPEFGIKLALGAAKKHLVWLLLREALILSGCGIAMGMVGGWWTARGLRVLLYDGVAADTVNAIAGVGLILTTTMIAAAVPIFLATRLSPADLLKMSR